MKNHKATKPAFNVGPAKRHLNGPLLVVFGSFQSTNKRQRYIPSGSAHASAYVII